MDRYTVVLRCSVSDSVLDVLYASAQHDGTSQSGAAVQRDLSPDHPLRPPIQIMTAGCGL